MDNDRKNRNLTGDEQNLDDLVRTLTEAGDSDTPEAIRKLDEGDDSVQGKASHAYAQLKRQAKNAATALDKVMKENEELRRGKSTQVAPTQGGASSAAASILQGFQLQAMMNLGLTSVTSQEELQLVQMEAARLYNKSASEIEMRTSLKPKAAAIIEDKLSKYPHLDEDGTAEVKMRLSLLPLEKQVDDDSIRDAVVRYIGEQALSGRPVTTGAGDNGDGAGIDDSIFEPEDDGASKAAASSVKTGRRDGTGVRLAKQKGAKAPEPAKPEELREMRKLGMHDLNAYRAAKQRKADYAGR